MRLFGCLVASCVALTVHAQSNPRIGYAFPAGGKQGTEFIVTLGGKNLDGANVVRVSGAGVRAYAVEYQRPLSQGQADALRTKLRELEEKLKSDDKGGRGGAATRPWGRFAEEEAIADIRRKLAAYQRRPPIPQLAETVTFRVKIAADAPPGERELRLETRDGVSNPVVFCVGQLQEFREFELRGAGQPELLNALPVIINGQIMPGEVDRYRFRAKANMRLVAMLSARQLIPYLADAVPGWFQGSLVIYDASGREVAFADQYRFAPDPVLLFKVPKDGDYTLEIRDTLYRGREDFVYRVSLGELPFITDIFPLGGAAGAQTRVDLGGWNLRSLRYSWGDAAPGVHPLSVRYEDLVSNRIPFAVDTLAEELEKEPNDKSESAQPVIIGTVMNGRIDWGGDRDVFRITGKAGQEIVAEVMARRLDSPLDSTLRLSDSTGKTIAYNDDFATKASGLNTHHADSFLLARLPADGDYFITIADAQKHGGLEYAYRLRISAPQPDFELRLAPSSLSVGAGKCVPFAVHVIRKDGFTGEILVSLKDAPKGFSLAGARIPPGQSSVRMTLMAPASALREPVTLRMVGQAVLGGKTVEKQVTPADDVMQAFFYRHLVCAQELRVVVIARSSQQPTLAATRVQIPLGSTTRVKVDKAPPESRYELNEPIEGISLTSENDEIVLSAEGEKLKPGVEGNLIINVLSGKQKTPVAILPALPFITVAK